MYLERKEDLSIIYFLKDRFSSVAGINIEDGFPDKLLTIPTLAVEAGKIELHPFEIGNRYSKRLRVWEIDIFAKNKSQRDEFGYKLLKDLENGIIVYDYDMGFPPLVTPSKIGHLQIVTTTLTPIRINPALSDSLYYRATLLFIAYNESV